MIVAVWLTKAERALTTAKLNLKHGDPDSACNRAYYCMFNAARASLLIVGQDERAMAKTHSGMIASFAEFIVKPGHVDAKHSRDFALESRQRILSDYTGQSVSDDEAKSAINNAEKFLAAVKHMDESKAE